MDLSSMYGITLPVLLFSLQKEEIVGVLKSIDSKFNKFIIEDFKKSLNFMQQLGDVISVGRSDAPVLTDALKRTPILNLSMEDQITVNNDIKFLVISEMAKLELTGNLFAKDFTIDSFLTDINHTSYVKARRSIRELLPKHLSATGSGQTFQNIMQYNLELIVPDTLNGITLTDLDKKILKFYYFRLIEYSADIYGTLNNIDDLDSESVQMLLRRPRAMYYRVYDALAPMQDVTTLSVLNKTIGDLRANLDLQYDNICNTAASTQFDVEDVIEKVLNVFSVGNLNSRFQVNMDLDEWYKQFCRMDDLCICGMNFTTRLLYNKAILDYTPKSGIVSDDSTLAEYKDVILDIKAALDSLIPFNAPI